MPLTMKFTLTANEFVETQQVFSRALASPVARFIYHASVPVGMFLLLGGMVVAALKLNVALGAFSIVIGACIAATRTSRARTLQKEFAQYPDSSKDLEFEFGENGVLVQSGHAKVEGEWARFSRFAETNDLFVLFTPPRGLTILPKRVLSPSDLEALRELLRRKLPRS